ncbi:uncharacterized protein ACBT44_014783 isoform 1-T1 [Syngnathus typhle]
MLHVHTPFGKFGPHEASSGQGELEPIPGQFFGTRGNVHHGQPVKGELQRSQRKEEEQVSRVQRRRQAWASKHQADPWNKGLMRGSAGESSCTRTLTSRGKHLEVHME